MSPQAETPNGRPGKAPWLVSLACGCLLAAATAAMTIAQPPDRRPAVIGGAGDVRAAATAARAFSEDYLQWLSGHLSARNITGASAELSRRLAAERVRRSRARRRDRQITELRTDLTSPTAGRAVAHVVGRDVRLQITLTLTHGPHGWEVTDARI